MALADLVPGALELLKERARDEGREEGRKEEVIVREKKIFEVKTNQLKRVLTKKIGNEPKKELFKNLSEESLNKIEDKLFEIETWEEVEELIK